MNAILYLFLKSTVISLLMIAGVFILIVVVRFIVNDIRWVVVFIDAEINLNRLEREIAELDKIFMADTYTDKIKIRYLNAKGDYGYYLSRI